MPQTTNQNTTTVLARKTVVQLQKSWTCRNTHIHICKTSNFSSCFEQIQKKNKKKHEKPVEVVKISCSVCFETTLCVKICTCSSIVCLSCLGQACCSKRCCQQTQNSILKIYQSPVRQLYNFQEKTLKLINRRTGTQQ